MPRYDDLSEFTRVHAAIADRLAELKGRNLLALAALSKIQWGDPIEFTPEQQVEKAIAILEGKDG